MLFFTRIKPVACVLACACAIARIKWRRLNKIIANNKKVLDVDFFCLGAHTIHGVSFCLRKHMSNANRYNSILRWQVQLKLMTSIINFVSGLLWRNFLFDNITHKLCKNSEQCFSVLSDFAWFLDFSQNALQRIESFGLLSLNVCWQFGRLPHMTHMRCIITCPHTWYTIKMSRHVNLIQFKSFSQLT